MASDQLPGELRLQAQLPTVQALKPQPFHAEDLDLLVGGSAQVPPKSPYGVCPLIWNPYAAHFRDGAT